MVKKKEFVKGTPYNNFTFLYFHHAKNAYTPTAASASERGRIKTKIPFTIVVPGSVGTDAEAVGGVEVHDSTFLTQARANLLNLVPLSSLALPKCYVTVPMVCPHGWTKYIDCTRKESWIQTFW